MPQSTVLRAKDIMDQPISLRRATPEDAYSIAALGSHVFSLTFGYSMPEADLDAYLSSSYSLSSISGELSNSKIDIIVAVDALDRVVGFSQLNRGTTEECVEGSPKPVELQRLYVSPDLHGKGIGKMLVDEIQRLAREQGYVTIWLGVWEENHKAQKVYERLGFRRIGKHDFTAGTCVQTDDILSKLL